MAADILRRFTYRWQLVPSRVANTPLCFFEELHYECLITQKPLSVTKIKYCVMMVVDDDEVWNKQSRQLYVFASTLEQKCL